MCMAMLWFQNYYIVIHRISILIHSSLQKTFKTNRFVVIYLNNHMMTTFVVKGQHVYLLSIKIALTQ
jgi:hypothetical protein